MEIELIIPTYNNLSDLQQCLAALEQQTFRNFKVWVCVDGSTDGTLQWLSSARYNFEFDFLSHTDGLNHGRAATRNLPLHYLTAPYIVMIDSDVVPDAALLEAHLPVVKAGSLSLGRIVYTDNKNLWTEYISTRGANQYEHLAASKYNYVDSANVAMPLAYFKAVNGFDEHLVSYGGEDFLLGYCIHRCFPEVKFIHNKKAVVHEYLDKTLAEALAQRELFAASGMHYIKNAYPEFTDFFKMDFLLSRRAKYLYHLSQILHLEPLLSALIPHMPVRGMRLLSIHFLVFINIYRGYFITYSSKVRKAVLVHS